MGKIKAFLWFVVIMFLLFTFVTWFIDNPDNAGRAASGAGGFLSDMKHSLEIFWSTLFR